jgi:hypothetical protein
MRTMFRTEKDPINQQARRRNGYGLIENRHLFVLLVRQNLAKPSYAPGEHEYATEEADARAGDEAGSRERAAEREHDRPRSGRGQMNDRAWPVLMLGLELFCHHLPNM